LQLLTVDTEQLGIPETDYSSVVTMPSGEFQKICRDLNTLGDTVSIATTKDGVRFSVTGELGTGNISLKPTDAADAKVIPSYAKCV
jgi:proliferating cell nuclear antigen